MNLSIEHPPRAPVTAVSSFSELNRQWLVAAIGRLRERIEARSTNDPARPAALIDCFETEPIDGFTPALRRCAGVFGLSRFECELLLLVAGLELDQGLRAAVLGLTSGRFPWANYSLALAMLTEPHWDALSPAGPLRWWNLVSPEPGAMLAQAALHIDERVLHFISGVEAHDARLDGIATILVPPRPDESGEDLALARRIARSLVASGPRGPVAVLRAPDREGAARRDLALAVAGECGCPALWIAARDLPGDAATQALLSRHVDREHALTGALPVLSVDSPADEPAALGLAGRLGAPLLWLGTPGAELSALAVPRPVHRFELPQRDRRRGRETLLARFQHLALPDIRDDPLVITAVKRSLAQFRLDAADLEQLADGLTVAPPAGRAAGVWAAARAAARGGLDQLSQRIETRVSFEDLVLPTGQTAALRDIARQLQHRERVYEEWEFGRKHQLGQGLVALFSGEPGTGKTLAAEAIATAVDLDLYRVDLATLVSKYIGETEKNLKRLFDAAETSGAVLLFDEADALFGKRSEVKDSHDRYANIEVAYLLQRIEAYRGLAVLTTNMKSALDRAFLRRIRFVINFPFPDAAARAEIWRRQFPAAAPLGAIDFAALSRLNLSGGHIRSIAINAAFKAADRGGVIDQELVIASAREEFAKLERPIGDALRGASE